MLVKLLDGYGLQLEWIKIELIHGNNRWGRVLFDHYCNEATYHWLQDWMKKSEQLER